MFFPKKILAIDISDNSIEVLEMRKFLGRVKVSFLSRSELPRGIVEKGKILNQKQLVTRLKEYTSGAKAGNLAFILQDTITFNHIFKFPADKPITDEMILKEAKNSLLIDLDKCYFNFSVSKATEETTVFFAAAFKKDVDQYKDIFKELKLNPKIFEPNSLCVLRALEIPHENALVADLGGRFGIVNIFDQGSLQLSGVVNFGGENFTEKLADKLNVPYEQAELYKMTVGFDADKEEGRVFLALQEVLQPLIDEIRKTINFYEEKNQKKIQKIILSGGSSLIPRLDEYIFSNFNIDVQIGRPYLGQLVIDYLKSNKINVDIDTIFFASTLGASAGFLGMKSPFAQSVNLSR